MRRTHVHIVSPALLTVHKEIFSSEFWIAGSVGSARRKLCRAIGQINLIGQGENCFSIPNPSYKKRIIRVKSTRASIKYGLFFAMNLSLYLFHAVWRGVAPIQYVGGGGVGCKACSDQWVCP